MTRIVYIGNFSAPFCTEVYLKRAFEENGCEVLPTAQDDAFRVGPDRFVAEALALDPLPNALVYTRTHSATALTPDWTACWRKLGDAGIVTAAIHLDRFWGLEREHLIRDGDPLFTVDHCFTADGGNPKRFAAAGVTHHWLPPAVDRLEASWPGVRRVEWEYDVAFVGSGKDVYHRQYAQRGELLDHLHSTYGRRFGHFGHGGNVRGAPFRQQTLNDVYASARVVIGDSCFANSSDPALSALYWSDRIPETLGRGGFLLHPFVVGVRSAWTPSELACYGPGDWDDLDARIGEFLANPGEREGFVERGRARTLAEHTYTHRARTVLETCGLLADDAIIG